MNRAFIVAALMGAVVACPLAAAQTIAARPVQPPSEPSVEALTVTGALAPVPKVGAGAPLFTAEELTAAYKEADKARRASKDALDALEDCSTGPPYTAVERTRMKPYLDGFEAAQIASDAAETARAATQVTIELRRKLPLGQATADELEAAELKRQAAVNRMVQAQAKIELGKAEAVFLNELSQDGVRPEYWEDRLFIEEQKWRKAAEAKAQNPIPAMFADLAVQKVAVRVVQDKNGSFLRVTGEVRNTRARKIAQPALSFTALDAQGLPLLTQIAQANGSIEPGKASPFAFELRPKPELAKSVEVTFADHLPPKLLFPPPHCFASPKRMLPIPRPSAE